MQTTKIWIAETGEYEQRYTAFAAVSPAAALAYALQIHPEGEWVHDTSDVIATKTGEILYKNNKLVGKVYINRARGEHTTPHEYDLSELDLAAE